MKTGKNNFLTFILVLFCSHLFWNSFVNAQTKRLISFQAYLTDSEGKALSGVHDLTFKIYDQSENGQLLPFDKPWEDIHSDVSVNKGMVNVILGSQAGNAIPDTLLFNGPRYIGISIDGEPEMLPRQQIIPAIYAVDADRAFHATEAQNAETADSAASVDDDSVSSAKIKDFEVRASDLHPDALSGGNIQDAILSGNLRLNPSKAMFLDEPKNTRVYSGDKGRLYLAAHDKNILSLLNDESGSIASILDSDLFIHSGRKFYLDGPQQGPQQGYLNDTYITEIVPNVIRFVVNRAPVADFWNAGLGIYGIIRPQIDNTFACGSQTNRWTAVFAVNGTIQTSVSWTKKDISDLTSDKVVVPRPATYLRNEDKHSLKHIGFIADDLPEECFAVYFDDTTKTYKRSKEDIYTDSVIGILCAKIEELEKRINALEAK